jgi:hypothetical protein
MYLIYMKLSLKNGIFFWQYGSTGASLTWKKEGSVRFFQRQNNADLYILDV